MAPCDPAIYCTFFLDSCSNPRSEIRRGEPATLPALASGLHAPSQLSAEPKLLRRLFFVSRDPFSAREQFLYAGIARSLNRRDFRRRQERNVLAESFQVDTEPMRNSVRTFTGQTPSAL
jgi:hypothetical protein